MPRAPKEQPRKKLRAGTAQARDDSWDSFFESLSRLEIVLIAGAVVLMLLLIYTIQEVLSPFLVLGAIIFLLFPMRTYTLPRTIMWLAVTLFAIWFTYSISSILAPFVVSYLLAYILNPVVTKLASWKIPRWISSLVLILISIGIIVTVLFFVLPIAVTQFEGLLDGLSRLFEDFRQWMLSSKFNAVLERYGVSAEEFRNTLTNRLTPRFEDVIQDLFEATLTLMSSVTKFATRLFYVILVPFLTFFLLKDFPKIRRQLVQLVPAERRARTEYYMDKADSVIGRYLRGVITVALLQGILVVLLFSLFGIKYAMLLGIMASILDLVPYFGLLITMALGAVVAVFSEGNIVQKVVLAITTIGILHLLEVAFLAPRIVGRSVGLHPLLIILSLLVFAYFLGFIGLLIAVPVTALVIMFVREWEAERKGMPAQHYHTEWSND
jgi:predicted PurR-regulated permease PerM